MANYNTLKEAIQAVIKTNGNEEITGSILQQSLLAMINSLGAGYQYAGVATPETSPGTPDYNVVYLASEAGTYTNFGGIVVADGEVALLTYDGTWSKEVTGAASAEAVETMGGRVDAMGEAVEEVKGEVDEILAILDPVVEISPEWTLNKVINATTGAVGNDSGNHLCASVEYIDISRFDEVEFDLVLASRVNGAAVYDGEKNFLQGWAGTGASYSYERKTIQVTGGIAYLRLTSANPATHPESGGYAKVIGRSSAESPFVKQDQIANNLSTEEEGHVLDARQGAALLDMIAGGYVNVDKFGWQNGAIVATTGVVQTGSVTGEFRYSDYINVARFGTMKSKWPNGTTAFGSAFYDSNKTYITGQALGSGQTHGYTAETTIAIPDNAAYVRITAYKSETYGLPLLVLYAREGGGGQIVAGNKLANPYFTTFDAYNRSAATPLVKDMVFSPSVDPFGAGLRRCPTTIITNLGTILATCVQMPSLSDASNTGIVLARLSGGQWDYTNILPYDPVTQTKYMNPCLLIDRTGAHGHTGRIFLFYLTFPVTQSNGGWAYLCSTEEMDSAYIYSDDDGVTWSNPVSTKSAWDTSEWTWVACSPANGVQLANGTLAIPCMGRYNGQWYSGVATKAVGGSWSYSRRTPTGADDESTCYEGLTANTLYLNCRNEANSHVRSLYQYDFSTGSFAMIPYDFDPNIKIQMSICKYATSDAGTFFFQTSPDPLTTETRERITLWISADAMAWQRMIRMDDATGYGYSVAEAYGNKAVIIYEGSGVVYYTDLSSFRPSIINAAKMSLGKDYEARMQEIVERFL